MKPHETPHDILARGFALVLQGLDAYQAAMLAGPKADPTEIMTGAQAAEEAGVTPTAVAKWCMRGFITDARQRRRRGHWRFTRGAWEAFRTMRRRILCFSSFSELAGHGGEANEGDAENGIDSGDEA